MSLNALSKRNAGIVREVLGLHSSPYTFTVEGDGYLIVKATMSHTIMPYSNPLSHVFIDFPANTLKGEIDKNSLLRTINEIVSTAHMSQQNSALYAIFRNYYMMMSKVGLPVEHTRISYFSPCHPVITDLLIPMPDAFQNIQMLPFKTLLIQAVHVAAYRAQLLTYP